MKSFLKVAAMVPKVKIADAAENARQTVRMARAAAADGARLIVFPEMSLCGYSIGDLVQQDRLLSGVGAALALVARETAELDAVVAVGLPVDYEGRLYNAAAILYRGEVCGVVPKTYLPNYGEFYDARWYASGGDLRGATLRLAGVGAVGGMAAGGGVAGAGSVSGDGTGGGVGARSAAEAGGGTVEVPFGIDVLFDFPQWPGLVLGAEICEDLWTPLPPSTLAALAGATVIVNLSASNELVGKSQYRRQLVSQQSARTRCGYVYVSAGVNESTTDVVFGGHVLVCENGSTIAENERFGRDEQIVLADIDLDHLAHDRRFSNTFANALTDAPVYRRVAVEMAPAICATVAPARTEAAAAGAMAADTKTVFAKSSAVPAESLKLASAPAEAAPAKLYRPINAHPFVPANPATRDRHSAEVFAIQSAGLATRMENAHREHLVIGVSGGLDSTLALLVARQAFGELGLPTANIHAITMPGFATSHRTKSNAVKLAEQLGISLEEVDITAGCRQQLADISHDGETQDVTFENVQARYRTMVLMNSANKSGALVLGTGDLSEIALGWCTFNGDHISHYNVNATVPKTLVRHLVDYAAGLPEFAAAADTLRDILDTPVSPELVTAKPGEISQSTEDLIGPYELHDFFLYHFVRWATDPAKIELLARQAFAGVYADEEIAKWLGLFIKRFFGAQWKRSVASDGPKVGSVALSPRGDWRMPSDAAGRLWTD